MQLDHARLFMIEKLERELPAYLIYHNAQHTRNVLQAAAHIAKAENVTGPDLELLLTAALFHDTGFLEAACNHEEISCKIAGTFLAQFEYTQKETEAICELIMATRMPQRPHCKLAEILCDADLYYLGTDDYFSTAEKLFRELKECKKVTSKTEWNKQQLLFLESHHFFTDTAKKELNQKKRQNVASLKLKQQGHKIKKSGIRYDFFNDLFLIILGVITSGFALKGFLVPNNFLDGGITGISLLIHEVFHFNLSYVVLLANLPFIISSYYKVNHQFAIKTFCCVLLLAVCLLYLPYPVITSDKLLVSVFGGFFLGIGGGLIMRAGCALDGIEVLALYTLKRTSFTITEIILALNVVIFGIAGLKFGIETALYSMLVYFTASKTVDYVVEGIEAYTGVTIISGKSEMIKDRLVNELGRGITVYKGERGFLPGQFEIYDECDIIFTVITRLEIRKLKNVVYETDPNAFVFANTIKEASGGVIKRRHIH